MTRRQRLTAATLAVAAVVNLITILGLPLNALPFRDHEDPDIGSIFSEERASLDLEYRFYWDLRTAAAGLRIAAVDGVLDPTFVDGMADMELEVLDRTPAVPPVRQLPANAVTGRFLQVDGTTVDYAIIPPEPGESAMVVAHSDGRLLVVGEQVAPRS